MIEQTAELAEMIERMCWHQRTRMVETTKIDRTEELSLFRFGFDDSACHTAMGFPGLASLAEMIDMGLASLAEMIE